MNKNQRRKEITYRKGITYVCAAILIAGLLTGCGGGNTGATVNTNAAASENTATATTATNSAVVTTAATAAATTEAAGDRTSLRVEVFDRAVQGGSDPTSNYWTNWINEQMLKRHNIEVSYISVPRSEEIQQLNVLMAGGDAPDIVFTYTQSVVYNYYRQGGTADLTDLIEQYGANIKNYLGEEVLSYGRFDGRQYMIPAKRVSRSMYTTYMRKDWLDALNLTIPTNLDEFYNALTAMKENNPGGVEQLIPYASSSEVPWHFGTIMDSFIAADLTDEQKFVLGIDASSSASTLLYPGFKDGISFINKMYNAGLVDPQFPLYKDFSPCDDLISRGVVGAFTANYDYPIRTTPGVYNNLKTNVPTAELVPVDCFPNADGKNLKQLYLPTGIYNFVPAYSKNIENAVKYFNFLCEDETRTYLTCGEEGVNHTKDSQGIPVMINLQNDERMMNSPNNLDYAMIVNGVDLGDVNMNIKVLSKSYQEGYEDIFEQAYNISYKDAIVFNPLIIPFESEAQFTANLNEKRKEILAAAITASEANFDAVYEAGIQEWLSVGGQQCLDERQAYWDSTH